MMSFHFATYSKALHFINKNSNEWVLRDSFIYYY